MPRAPENSDAEIQDLKARLAAFDLLFVSLFAHLQALPGVFPGLMDSALTSAAQSAERQCQSSGAELDDAAATVRHVEAFRHMVLGQTASEPRARH